MNCWSFYEANTGEFAPFVYTGRENTLAINTPDGYVAVPGVFSHTRHRMNIESMTVEDFVPDSPGDSELIRYEWDPVSWAWVSKPTILSVANNARMLRDSLLGGCDWTQIPDAALTEQQKEDWRSYRQALRDVPDQAGFPNEIIWPEPPHS